MNNSLLLKGNPLAKLKAAHNLQRHQEIDVEIQSIAGGGAGVAKVDGLPVFIERAAVGDKLRVKLFDVRKDFAKGSIEKVLESGGGRAEPVCQHFERCGGCQWQHMSYAEQLRSKTNVVREALTHLGGSGNFNSERLSQIFEPILPAQNPIHYRNKAQFPFQFKMGKTLAGYYERNSHDLVNVQSCSIQPQSMDRVLHYVRDLVRQYRINIYDEQKHKGLLRHLNVRMSFAKQKMLITFVINHAPVKYKEFASNEDLLVFGDMAKDLMDADSSIESVALNFNSDRGNRIMGDHTVILLGRGYIEEELKTERADLPEFLRKGLTFRLSSESFFQVNSAQAVKLLEQVTDYAQIALKGEKANVIVDAYAGVGTIAAWLSGSAREVIAVEENPDAVNDGKQNAALNNLGNLSFVPARVEDALDQILEDTGEIDLLVLDPPRKGASPEVLQCVKERGPRHIIYVSCNPATLARDLRILEDPNRPAAPDDGAVDQSPAIDAPADVEEEFDEQERLNNAILDVKPVKRGEESYHGYKTIRIRPVDLFPQTYHVETVVLLERI